MNHNGCDPHQFGAEAYLYLYPVVSIEATCGQMTNIEGQIPDRAAIQQFAHITEFPAGNRRASVRPDCDLKRAVVARAGPTASSPDDPCSPVLLAAADGAPLAHFGAGLLLPAPAGQPGTTMRIYAPRRRALDGRWDPLLVRRGVTGGRLCGELGS
jgi:hypothetical protein